MAKKGFYSYDRDAESDTYHLVAYPTKPIDLEKIELPKITVAEVTENTIKI